MAAKSLLIIVLFLATGTLAQKCRQGSNCITPKCSCATTDTPGGYKPGDIPQFVMFSFDDGVNILNVDHTYRKLFMGNLKNKDSQCFAAATFFVTHEYTNYQLVHELYRYGNEMAVHSITHVSDTERWREANYSVWKAEMQGMKQIISRYAKIPLSRINGHRAPFLQTAGDTTFNMLKAEGFLYDSTMPTLGKINPPLWPYTLDYAYNQDCQIAPCPESKWPGLWLVPLVNYISTKNTNFRCAMADACTPYPETVNETFQYFMQNFNRHYNSNRAPFPVFLHEAWLKNKDRYEGYVKFINWLLEKNDVYLVTIQTVIEYMKNPVTLRQYRQANCVTENNIPKSLCDEDTAYNCMYENLPQFYNGTRYMMSCIECPSYFPWLNDPYGTKRPTFSTRRNVKA